MRHLGRRQQSLSLGRPQTAASSLVRQPSSTSSVPATFGLISSASAVAAGPSAAGNLIESRRFCASAAGTAEGAAAAPPSGKGSYVAKGRRRRGHQHQQNEHEGVVAGHSADGDLPAPADFVHLSPNATMATSSSPHSTVATVANLPARAIPLSPHPSAGPALMGCSDASGASLLGLGIGAPLRAYCPADVVIPRTVPPSPSADGASILGRRRGYPSVCDEREGDAPASASVDEGSVEVKASASPTHHHHPDGSQEGIRMSAWARVSAALAALLGGSSSSSASSALRSSSAVSSSSVSSSSMSSSGPFADPLVRRLLGTGGGSSSRSVEVMLRGALPAAALTMEECAALELLEDLLTFAETPSLIHPSATSESPSASPAAAPLYADNRTAVLEALLQLASFTDAHCSLANSSSSSISPHQQQQQQRHRNDNNNSSTTLTSTSGGGGRLWRIIEQLAASIGLSGSGGASQIHTAATAAGANNIRGGGAVRWFVHCRVLCALAAVAASLGQHRLASAVVVDVVRPLLHSVAGDPLPSTEDGGYNHEGGYDDAVAEAHHAVLDTYEGHEAIAALAASSSGGFGSLSPLHQLKISAAHALALAAWCEAADGEPEKAVLLFEEALGYALLGTSVATAAAAGSAKAKAATVDGAGKTRSTSYDVVPPLQFAGGRLYGSDADLGAQSSFTFVMCAPLSYPSVALSYASFLFNSRDYGAAMHILRPLATWLRDRHRLLTRGAAASLPLDGASVASPLSKATEDGGSTERAFLYDTLLLMGRCARSVGVSAAEVAELGISGLTAVEEALGYFEEAERLEGLIAADGASVVLSAARASTGDANRNSNLSISPIAAACDAMESLATSIANHGEKQQQQQYREGIASDDSEEAEEEDRLIAAALATLSATTDVATTTSVHASRSAHPPPPHHLRHASSSAAYDQALAFHYDYVIPTASATSEHPTHTLGRRALACYDRAAETFRRRIADTQRFANAALSLKDALLLLPPPSLVAASDGGVDGNTSLFCCPHHRHAERQRAVTAAANSLLLAEDTLKSLYTAYAACLFDAGALHEGLAGGMAAAMAPSHGPLTAGAIYREALRALEAAGRSDASARVRLAYARSLMAAHNLGEAQQQLAEALAITIGAAGVQSSGPSSAVAAAASPYGGNTTTNNDPLAPLHHSSTYRTASSYGGGGDASSSSSSSPIPQLAAGRSYAYLSAGEVHAHIAHFYHFFVPSDSDDTLTATTALAERHYLQALDYSGIDVDAVTYAGIMRLPSAEESVAEADSESAAASPVSAAAGQFYNYAPISPFPMDAAAVGWALEGFALLLMNLPREFSLASKLLRTRIILAEHAPPSAAASVTSSSSATPLLPPSPHKCVTAYTALAGCLEHLASHGMGPAKAAEVLRALLRVPSAHTDVLQRYEITRRYAALAAQMGDYATAAEMFRAAIGLTNACPELYIQYAQCLGRVRGFTDVGHLATHYELAVASFELNEAVARRREGHDAAAHLFVSSTNGDGGGAAVCGPVGMASTTPLWDLGLPEEEAQHFSEPFLPAVVSGLPMRGELIFGNVEAVERLRTERRRLQERLSCAEAARNCALSMPSTSFEETEKDAAAAAAAVASEAAKTAEALLEAEKEIVEVSEKISNIDAAIRTEMDTVKSPPYSMEALAADPPQSFADLYRHHPARAVATFEAHLSRDSTTAHRYDPFYVYSETALFLQTVKMDYRRAEGMYRRLLKTYDASRTSTENYAQTLVNYALLKQQHTDDAAGARVLFTAALRVDPTRHETRLSFAEFLYAQQAHGEALRHVLAILDPTAAAAIDGEGSSSSSWQAAGYGTPPPPTHHEEEEDSFVPRPIDIVTQLEAVRDAKREGQRAAAAAASTGGSSSSVVTTADGAAGNVSGGGAQLQQRDRANLSRVFAAVASAASSPSTPALHAPHRLHSLIGALKTNIAPDDVASVTESFLAAMGVTADDGVGAGEAAASSVESLDDKSAQLFQQTDRMLEALRTTADPAIGLSYLAYLGHKTLHYNVARAGYDALLLRFPSDAAVLLGAAQFYGDGLRDRATARRLFLRAMRVDPSDVNAISSAAIFLMTAYPKRFEEADALFRRAMAIAAEGLMRRGLEPGEDGVPVTAAVAKRQRERRRHEAAVRRRTAAAEAEAMAAARRGGGEAPANVTATAADAAAAVDGLSPCAAEAAIGATPPTPTATAMSVGNTPTHFEECPFHNRPTEAARSSNRKTDAEVDADANDGEPADLLDLGVTLNYLSFLVDYRWSPVAGYALFQRALKAFPRSAQLHCTYAAFLDRYAASRGRAARPKGGSGSAAATTAAATAAASKKQTSGGDDSNSTDANSDEARFEAFRRRRAADDAALRAAAIRHYQQAIALSPSKAVPYLMLGSSLSRQKKYEEALGHLQHAARLEPANETALESCANVLFSWYSHLVTHQGSAVDSGGASSADGAASSTSATDSSLPSGSLASSDQLLRDLFPSDTSSSLVDPTSSSASSSPLLSDPSAGIGRQPTGSLSEIREAAVFYYRRLIALNPLSLHYLSAYARFISEGLQNEAVGNVLYDAVARVEAARNRARRESTVMLSPLERIANAAGDEKGKGAENTAEVSSGVKPADDGDAEKKKGEEGGRPSTASEVWAAVAAAEAAAKAQREAAEEAEAMAMASEAAGATSSSDALHEALSGAEEDPSDASPSSSSAAEASSASGGLRGRPSTIEEVLAAVAAAEAAKAARLAQEALDAEVTVDEEEAGESEEEAEAEEQEEAEEADSEANADSQSPPNPTGLSLPSA